MRQGRNDAVLVLAVRLLGRRWLVDQVASGSQVRVVVAWMTDGGHLGSKRPEFSVGQTTFLDSGLVSTLHVILSSQQEGYLSLE